MAKNFEFKVVCAILVLAAAVDIIAVTPDVMRKSHKYTQDDCDAIKDILLEKRDPSRKEKIVFDINGDGRISLTDYVLVKRKVINTKENKQDENQT